MSDEVVEIHMASRTYARDGTTAFVEARVMMATSDRNFCAAVYDEKSGPATNSPEVFISYMTVQLVSRHRSLKHKIDWNFQFPTPSCAEGNIGLVKFEI